MDNGIFDFNFSTLASLSPLNLKKQALNIAFLLVTAIVLSQEPVSIHLTSKDGLPDIEFYDIIEDSKGFIWLAADKGLFRYNGKEYKNYSNPKKRGLSVFNLKLDHKDHMHRYKTFPLILFVLHLRMTVEFLAIYQLI